MNAGLVEGKNLAVDGTLVEANASPQSRTRHGQVHQIQPVSQSVQQYLSELQEHNSVADAKIVSTTDPDAVWAKKEAPAKIRTAPLRTAAAPWTNAPPAIIGINSVRSPQVESKRCSGG